MSRTKKWIIAIVIIIVIAIAFILFYPGMGGSNWDKIKLWWKLRNAIQRDNSDAEQRSVPTIPVVCPDWSNFQYGIVNNPNSPYNNNLSFSQAGNSCPSCIIVNGIKYITNGSISNPAINNTICFYKPLNSGTRAVPTIPVICPDWSNQPVQNVIINSVAQLFFPIPPIAGQELNCPSCIIYKGVQYIFNGKGPGTPSSGCYYKPFNSGT